MCVCVSVFDLIALEEPRMTDNLVSLVVHKTSL